MEVILTSGRDGGLLLQQSHCRPPNLYYGREGNGPGRVQTSVGPPKACWAVNHQYARTKTG